MSKCIKCGSYAFNLYKEDIDQGGLCDVHYWQYRAHRAEALAQQPARPYRLLQDNGSKYFGESWDKAEQPAQQQEPWEHHAKKLTQWLHCMSYNDSYFGEPAGLVKQVTGELNRLIGAFPPAQKECEKCSHKND